MKALPRDRPWASSDLNCLHFREVITFHAKLESCDAPKCALTQGTHASNRMKRFLQLIERAHSTAHWGQLPAGGGEPPWRPSQPRHSESTRAGSAANPPSAAPSLAHALPSAAPRTRDAQPPLPLRFARARKPSAKALPRVLRYSIECSESRPPKPSRLPPFAASSTHPPRARGPARSARRGSHRLMRLARMRAVATAHPNSSGAARMRMRARNLSIEVYCNTHADMILMRIPAMSTRTAALLR